MNELVYLSLGEGKHVPELRFAMSSALHFWREDASWRVVLYTDRPELFEGIRPVEVRTVSAEQVERWIGPHRYVFFGTIRTLEDALGHADKAMIVDGDTYFTKSPAGLFDTIAPGHGMMHEREGLPHPPEIAGIRAALHDGPMRSLDGTAWPLTERQILWNAGVLGLAAADRGLCDEVAHLTTRLLDEGFGEHSRISEMVAFSLVFEQRLRIHESDGAITHYWRDEIRLPFHTVLAEAPAGADAAQIYRRLWPRRPRPTLERRLKHTVKRNLARVGIDFNRP